MSVSGASVPQVLLDRPFWRIELSGFSGGRALVAIGDASRLSDFAVLVAELDRFEEVDLLFTEQTDPKLAADLIAMFESSKLALTIESLSLGLRTTTFRRVRLDPEARRNQTFPRSDPPGSVLGGPIKGTRVGFVGALGLHLLGGWVRSVEIAPNWVGTLAEHVDNWLDVLVVDSNADGLGRDALAMLISEAREIGSAVIVISDGTTAEQLEDLADLMLNTNALASTSFPPGVVSPVGFRRVVGGRVGVVGSVVGGRGGVEDLVGLIQGLAEGPGVDVFGVVRGVSLPSSVRVFGGGFDAGLVSRLRGYGGVIDHPALHETVTDRAEVLVGLAAAGVPIAASGVDPVRNIIGDELAEILVSADISDLEDPEARDRLSVRLRRQGLSVGSHVGRWREIAGSLDLAVPPLPTVSVVLATNRPSFIAQAVSQVEAQTYPEIELVLVLHGEGFTQTDADLEESYRRPLHIVRVASKTVLGEVLNWGVAASTGSLIAKMDHDDWYAPEHISDLVTAMDYSGADLVGKAAEFVYLEELDITIRRMVDGAETYGNRNLAGGTLLIKRTTFNTIGGWRRVGPGFEDRSLIEDTIGAGAVAYRSHGHGYILNRHSQPHGWSVDDEYFRDQASVSSEGLTKDWALL